MLLRQFLDKESSTFTYIIAADYGCPAAIIDPVLEHVDLYSQFINEYELDLQYCIDTHTHADHITGSGLLAQQHQAKAVVSANSQAQPVDIKLQDQQLLELGSLELKAISTPGHTDCSICLACEDCLFTGDTLLIRGSGRTDFQSGDARQQYHNIKNKLFCYPDATRVYPGHDYKVLTVSTIGEEKRFNPRLLAADADSYAEIMDNLNLARPNKIETAVPANLKCGLVES